MVAVTFVVMTWNWCGVVAQLVERLVRKKIQAPGPILPSRGPTWPNPCKIRHLLHFGLDPLGPIYPSIFFTG